MSSVELGRKRAINEIRDLLRGVNAQLAQLNHQVGTRLEIKDVDLECLDLLARNGPLSPSALARRAGLHPATMTGVLDRLERGGWVTRERDPGDRRAVLVVPRKDRGAEIFRLYAGMNGALDEICAGYDEAELGVLADFLRRVASAGERSTAELAEPAEPAEPPGPRSSATERQSSV